MLDTLKNTVLPKVDFVWDVVSSGGYFADEYDMGMDFNMLVKYAETSNVGSLVSQLVYVQLCHQLRTMFRSGTGNQPDFVTLDGKPGFEFKKAHLAGKVWKLTYNKSYFSSEKIRVAAPYTVVAKLDKNLVYHGSCVINTLKNHDTSNIPSSRQSVYYSITGEL